MKLPKPSPQIKRTTVIVLASLGVGMLVLLAASLQSLELQPARAFFSNDGSKSNTLSELTDVFDNLRSLTLGEAIILVGGVLCLFALILAMLSAEGRKHLIKTILRVGLIALAIYYSYTKFRPQELPETEAQGTAARQAPQVVGPSSLYTPPPVPPWWIYLASLLVVLLFVGIGFWLYRALRPPKHQLRDLASAARSALKDLSAGRDWDDTVIQCYARMSEAVDQQRGLHRQQAMTPQEFAARLEQAGLPSDPVHRLTRLFEKARYGARSSSREDVNEAVTCLTAILQAVGA